MTLLKREDLLHLLCCPETHQALALAEPELVTRVNDGIRAGRIRNRAGQTLTMSLDGALVRQDNQVLYPVRQGIPLLLVDEGIMVNPQ